VTESKRALENARKEKQKGKMVRRQQRREEKGQRPKADGEDPDIAGIVPGPQPVQDDPN
jgi:hypothetical protein